MSSEKPKTRHQRPSPEETAIGQDTVIISNDTIVDRYSSLYKALMDMEVATDTDLRETQELTEKEGEFFYEILGRKAEDNKYVIRRQFARGGMGILYSVYDRDFRREAVMKVLLPDLKKDTTMIRTFIREARITAQLEHPNIVPVHDLGHLNDEGIYFTMKPVQGESLNDILYQLEVENPRYTTRYDFYSLLNIFRKVCDAVAYAHANGVLHRDIKPHNIMVGSFGEVFLMDWGLAKHIGEATTDIPLPDFDDDGDDAEEQMNAVVLKGSPGYMSPEQAGIGDGILDERSDIFLLGATLYHTFTFFPPYIGSSITTILQSARKCDFMALEEISFGGMEIPHALARIIKKCMAKEKHDRYQSTQELIDDLDALIHGKMDTESRIFAAGEMLIAEGDEEGPCYIIVRGGVEVYKGSGDNKTTLGVVGPGDIVGEMALITHRPRSASVQALQETEVMVMNNEQFERNLSRLQPWIRRTIVALAERLSTADQQLARNHENGE